MDQRKLNGWTKVDYLDQKDQCRLKSTIWTEWTKIDQNVMLMWLNKNLIALLSFILNQRPNTNMNKDFLNSAPQNAIPLPK